MITSILFIITFMFTFLNIIKMISIIFGNPISYPYSIPDRWFILYPCLLYQIYFWSVKFCIIQYIYI